MQKLVYIVDWLPPDHGAIGQYALKESSERAGAGEHVVLVGLTTGRAGTTVERLGGGSLTIHRLRSSPVDRVSFKRRAAWTLKTNARLVARAAGDLFSADEVLFTASPPFLEHLLVPLGKLVPGRIVFRIADLHPECMMNELSRVPEWLRMFHALTRALRRSADVVEVLGEDQRRILISQGVSSERIRLNRSGAPVRIGPETEPLDIPVSLQGRHVLLYSGAVAHAHEIDTFIEGYRLHHERGSGRAAFWLSAAGARADSFEARLRGLGLPIHRSAPVPLSELAQLLVTPAAHLITLRDDYTGLVVPSKVYGCIESGRDVLFVGSAASDVDLLCRREMPPNAYVRVNVGDAPGVQRALEHLCDRSPKRNVEPEWQGGGSQPS